MKFNGNSVDKKGNEYILKRHLKFLSHFTHIVTVGLYRPSGSRGFFDEFPMIYNYLQLCVARYKIAH